MNLSLSIRHSPLISCLFFAAATFACSATPPSEVKGTGTGGATALTSVGGSSATGGSILDVGEDPVVTGTGGSGSVAECDIDPVTGEEICTCIKLATWGALGNFGAVPGMDGSDAITEWLNANSTGDAEYFAQKPPITAEFLANYDVVILQDISSWSAFTPEELGVFDVWVRTGGGAISLNGYLADGNEMTNVNHLLAFTGMSYLPNSDTAGDVDGDCIYCYGSSIPQAGWDASHPISLSMTQVGAFHGRSIVAGDAVIVTQTAEGVLGATKQMDAGRVFMFHDEWVTYNSQWTGEGLVDDCRTEPAGHECRDLHPVNDYSSAQFWYNSIRWAAGDKECFTIEDPTIIVVK